MEKKNAPAAQIEALRKLTTAQLKRRYHQVFGEATKSNNKPYLLKRVAYRLQEKKHGGLTARARQRAEHLAKDAPIRRRPELKGESQQRARDPRLPKIGTVLRREFKGKEHTTTVLADGFDYRGKRFGSLSSIAKAITGTSWNGYGFFGLLGKRG
jgi:hypothetical protein